MHIKKLKYVIVEITSLAQLNILSGNVSKLYLIKSNLIEIASTTPPMAYPKSYNLKVIIYETWHGENYKGLTFAVSHHSTYIISFTVSTERVPKIWYYLCNF